MSSTEYDVAVIGLGGIGAGCFWALNQAGLNVAGIDPHPPGHEYGSSCGDSRLIRQAYFEHPDYVPLLKRTYELWRSDDQLSQCFHDTGLVIFGDPQASAIVQGTRQSAEEHGIQLEIWDDYRETPASASSIGVFEPGAGWLQVDAACRAFVGLAESRGATRRQTCFDGFEKTGDLFRIKTKQGEILSRDIVLCLGSWTPSLFPQLANHIQVRRVVMYWFDVGSNTHLPPYCFAEDTGPAFLYGFPQKDGLIKVATHAPGEIIKHPKDLDRNLRSEEGEEEKAWLQRLFGLSSAKLVRHKVCMYSMTADEHFIVGKLDDAYVCAGFSGHGFKFVPGIGDMVAKAIKNGVSFPSMFDPTRF